MALVGGYIRRAGDDSSKSYIERLLDIASDEAKNYMLTATAEVAVVVFLLKDFIQPLKTSSWPGSFGSARNYDTPHTGSRRGSAYLEWTLTVRV
jgi:hypothetical protein